MKLLLDTHIFIWWDSDPAKLSPRVLALCQDSSHTKYISVASIWEMQIKLQIGKLQLARPLADIVDQQRRINRFLLLPVHLEHALAVEQLPMHHKDPFDRILVAQSLVESMPLLSEDSNVSKYPVTVLW